MGRRLFNFNICKLSYLYDKTTFSLSIISYTQFPISDASLQNLNCKGEAERVGLIGKPLSNSKWSKRKPSFLFTASETEMSEFQELALAIKWYEERDNNLTVGPKALKQNCNLPHNFGKTLICTFLEFKTVHNKSQILSFLDIILHVDRVYFQTKNSMIWAAGSQLLLAFTTPPALASEVKSYLSVRSTPFRTLC